MVKMMFSFFWKGCLVFWGVSCYMSFRYIIVRCHSNVVLFEVMNSYTQLVSFGLPLKLIYLGKIQDDLGGGHPKWWFSKALIQAFFLRDMGRSGSGRWGLVQPHKLGNIFEEADNRIHSSRAW